MGIFDGCLLACDVDGTLMDSGYINPENIKKIEYFVNEGGSFSVATGRSVGAISDVLRKIKKISPSVLANGSMIFDYENSKPVSQRLIPKKDVGFLKTIIDMNYPLGMEIHSGTDVYTLVRTAETDLHQIYEELPTNVVEFDYISQLPIYKAILTFANAEEKAVFKELISKQEGFCDLESNFIDTCAVINGMTQNYYELVPKGVSKANALKELCEVLNIKEGCFFCIGDFYNDLEMIKSADISAVPCTSPEEIKSCADYITVSCDDGAVAYFIDYLSSKFNAK